MNTLLTRHLITTFTKYGDVVLDPMAGVGTTLVEGMLLGRNVVGVDIEEKFCKLIEGNLDNVKKINEKSRFKLHLGKGAVIKGDSRQLAQLLQNKMDAVVTSPPYSGAISKHAGGDKVRERFGGFLSESLLAARKYSEDERNIGNLSEHGKVDVVVTSPPYSEALSKRRKGYTKLKNLEHTREYPQESRDDNIGNLKHGESVDTVITSPPFGEEKSFQMFGGPRATNRKDDDSKTRVKKDYVRSENPNNVGKLTYPVDTIVTSPPFGEANRGSGIAKKGYAGKHGLDPKLHERHDRPLSDDPHNISNLPLGKVDMVLTSPPYAQQVKGSEVDQQKEAKALVEKCKNYSATPGRLASHVRMRSGYSQDPQNIGNLPPGNVDTVITSPPYADSVKAFETPEQTEKRRQRMYALGLTERDHKHGGLLRSIRANNSYRGFAEGYSKDPSNIGNLPHGNGVDAVITSPPYEATFNVKQHTLSGIAKRDPNLRKEVGGYGQGEANIGNLRRGKEGVDAIVTSPPYEGSVNAPNDPERRAERMLRAGLDPKTIVGGKARCGEIDWQYSENSQNVGNLKGETYLEAMLKVYREMHSVLKPGGLAIVVLKNFIRNWKVVDLIGDTVKLCEFCGFKLVKRIRFMLPTKSFWRTNYRIQYEKKFKKCFPEEQFASVYRFETVLVFNKS